MDAIESIKQTLHEIAILKSRSAKPEHHEAKEAITEREFVRKFGDKVAKVRWSGRGDVVGLIVVGRTCGIWVTRCHKTNKRVVRLVNVDGRAITVTGRKLVLRADDSLTYLWRGMLNWIK